MRWFSDSFYEQLTPNDPDHVSQNGHEPYTSASFDETEEQEIESLMTLAHSLQRAAPLQVDEHFADLLEKRLRVSAAQRAWAAQQTQRRRTRARRPRIASKRRGIMAVFAACACVGLLVLSAGGIALLVKSPHVPQRPVASTVQQVKQTDQAAHALLRTLNSLADPTHAQDYRKALINLDQQVVACAREVATVPSGSGWEEAMQELTELKADARGALYRLLVNLAFPERVLTTTELGKLGASVPVVSSAVFTLVPGKGQALILFHGSGISSGAHALVDGQEITGSGVTEAGGYEMTIPWSGTQPILHVLGVLNGDNTAAQTTSCTFQVGQNTATDQDGDGDGGHDGGQSGGGGGRDGGRGGSGRGGG